MTRKSVLTGNESWVTGWLKINTVERLLCISIIYPSLRPPAPIWSDGIFESAAPPSRFSGASIRTHSSWLQPDRNLLRTIGQITNSAGQGGRLGGGSTCHHRLPGETLLPPTLAPWLTPQVCPAQAPHPGPVPLWSLKAPPLSTTK